MSAPCYMKISEKEILPGVTEFKSEYCDHFSWQIFEENDVFKFLPTCAFGKNTIDFRNTEISGIPLRPPLENTEPQIVNRPCDCPIGIENKTWPLVFTKGKMEKINEKNETSQQTTLEAFC